MYIERTDQNAIRSCIFNRRHSILEALVLVLGFLAIDAEKLATYNCVFDEAILLGSSALVWVPRIGLFVISPYLAIHHLAAQTLVDASIFIHPATRGLFRMFRLDILRINVVLLTFTTSLLEFINFYLHSINLFMEIFNFKLKFRKWCSWCIHIVK